MEDPTMHTRTLMTLLLLSVPLDAQARRVEHEPNDTPAQADAIACGDQIDGTLLAGDADWFAFTLAANQLLQLCTSGGTPSQTTDTVLELYDGTGTQLLARNDDAGGTRGVSSTLLLSLAAGSYYARVRHFSVLGTGAYQLDCACLPPQTIGRHEGPEPNDSPGSGGTPTAVPADGQVAGTIGTPGDADWYGFTLPTRAGFIATVADGCAPPQLLDAQLRLLREIGRASCRERV